MRDQIGLLGMWAFGFCARVEVSNIHKIERHVNDASSSVNTSCVFLNSQPIAQTRARAPGLKLRHIGYHERFYKFCII